MTTSVISYFYGNKMLDGLRYGHFLALHEDAPDVSGSPANEVAGGAYERQPLEFSAPSAKTFATVNRQVFTSMPECTITDLAVWDSLAGGELCAVIHLDDPIDVVLDTPFAVEAGNIALAV